MGPWAYSGPTRTPFHVSGITEWGDTTADGRLGHLTDHGARRVTAQQFLVLASHILSAFRLVVTDTRVESAVLL